MATVLELRATKRSASRRDQPASGECEIVIFPGVRIERHASDLDLSHRLRDSAGDDFDGLGGKRRPRKTS